MNIKEIASENERFIRKTKIVDGKKEFIIHTDILDDCYGFDLVLQGFDTTGLIETLVEQIKPVNEWLENTKFQTNDRETALKFHQILIDYYKTNRKFDKDFTHFVVKSTATVNMVDNYWEKLIEKGKQVS